LHNHIKERLYFKKDNKMNSIKREFGKLNNEQKKQISQIISSKTNIGNEYYPCSVLLEKGEQLECVYLADINKFKGTTIYNLERDDSDIYVNITDVIKITESPHRLPPNISQKIYQGGETAMGGTIFTIEFSDNTEQLYGCGSLIDFLPLPPGKTMNDIINVRLHTVPIRTKYLRGLDYKFCYFSK